MRGWPTQVLSWRDQVEIRETAADHLVGLLAERELMRRTETPRSAKVREQEKRIRTIEDMLSALDSLVESGYFVRPIGEGRAQ